MIKKASIVARAMLQFLKQKAKVERFFDEAGVTAYTYLQLQETILQNRTDWHLASVSASTVVELLLSESRLRTVELI
jgi:hypothetical protein